MFAREIYIWAKLNHSNVVKLEGYSIEDGFPSLISEWAEHGTVVEYAKNNIDKDAIAIVRNLMTYRRCASFAFR